MLRIKKMMIALVAAFGLIAPLGLVGVASAQDIQQGLCAGVGFNASTNGCNQGDVDKAEGQATALLETVINIFSVVVGVIAVVMIIVGGVKYITSGGDSGNVTGAKNTILYAVIGLVIVALAQVIVRFVLGSVSDI